jgi:hypothetical protein
MTEWNGYDAPPNGTADGDREQRRRIIEDVLLAFRPELIDQFGVAGELPSRRQALENLAGAVFPRLLKHRLLIDAMRRVRFLPQGEPLDDAVRAVLASTLGEERESPRVEEAKRHLETVAVAEGSLGLDATHWALWVQLTNELFQFEVEERTFQACNDEDIVLKPTPDLKLVRSRLIVAEFWSQRRPADFATFINPFNWPRCSEFWRSVTVLQGPTPTDSGYDCDIEETVTILTGETLTVPLQVAFRIRPGGSRVWTRFNTSRRFFTPAVPVDVDTGTVSAESMPGGPAQTLVRATKYVHWRDPNRPDLTMLACDFGWSQLMMDMAYRCARGIPGATASTSVTTSVEDAVGRVVGDVTDECRNGISDCRPILEKLVRRFTGPSWDLRWINDLLAIDNVLVTRYGRIAGHVRRFADELGHDDHQDGDHG